MTVLNFTFQEASPLINYTGIWTEGSLTNDALAADYNGSFRVTQAANSSAYFSFVGTAVSLFGATRPSHGNYTVNVDQLPQFMASGFTGGNEFNKSLWHADNLGYTQHTVTLTNVPVPNQPFLDLDFVSIERQIGQPGDNIFQATLDDTSPSVSFVGAWITTTGVSSAHQGTLHSTKTANAQVIFSFQGCSVEIYGQYANAPYTVTLDSLVPDSFQGLDVDLAPNSQYPQTLLYLADGLSENINHTVTLTNSKSNQNRPFLVDFAVISSTHALNKAATPIAQSPGNSKHSTAVGPIVGGVLGALAIIAILGISAILLIRRRRRRRADRAIRVDLVDDEVKPYVIPYVINSDSALPPVPPRDDPSAPSSKSRPAVQHHRIDQSTNPRALLSSRRHPKTSASSGSYTRTGSLPTGSSASGSVVPSPQVVSTSPEDARRQVILQGDANNEDSNGPGREEDAGVVLDPEEIPASRPLPPAYNPDWDHNQS